MKIRGFEPVELNHRNKETQFYYLPQQSTIGSAGYDFRSTIDFTIEPNQTIKIPTNIKAYMQDDEVLEIHIRSSVGIKKNIILANCTGIIDSSFYSNSDNDGNITIALYNISDQIQSFKKGDKITQGIFKKYLVSDNGNSEQERIGGIGSTGI